MTSKSTKGACTKKVIIWNHIFPIKCPQSDESISSISCDLFVAFMTGSTEEKTTMLAILFAQFHAEYIAIKDSCVTASVEICVSMTCGFILRFECMATLKDA